MLFRGYTPSEKEVDLWLRGQSCLVRGPQRKLRFRMPVAWSAPDSDDIQDGVQNPSPASSALSAVLHPACETN